MTDTASARTSRSLFVVSAAVITVCILAVAATMAVLTLISARSTAEAIIRLRAHEVTGLVAMQSGGALRFGKPEVLDPLFKGVLADSGGDAVAILGMAASGEIVTGIRTDGDATLLRLAGQASESGTPASSEDGTVIAVPARFGKDDAVAGAVAIRWSTARSLSQAYRSTFGHLGIAAAVLVLSTLCATLFLRNYLSRPLLALCTAMRRVAEGDYEVTAPGLARPDEIGRIARELDLFRAALQKSDAGRRESAYKGAAFQKSPAALMLLGPNRNIRFVNEAMAALLDGLDAELRSAAPDFDASQPLGHRVPDLPLIGSQQSLLALLETRSVTGFHAEARLGERLITLHLSPVTDDAGVSIGMVVAWQDVTEQHRAAALLGAIDADQIRMEFDVGGKLITGNRLMQDRLDASAAAGSRLEAIFDLAQLETPSTAALLQSLLSGKTIFGQIADFAGNGRLFDASFAAVRDSDGQPSSIVLLAKDITDRETAMRESRDRQLAMQTAQSHVVRMLGERLACLAGGNLDARLETAFDPEYEALRQHFNNAVRSLAEAMAQVIEVAENIQDEATEIAGASDDLSRRTERNAATLEQTAAALDQLTASVGAAAEGAERADHAVTAAKSKASQSGGVVREAIGAMSEIESSSHQIAKIIDVIEDIAFQTNLLALNAGVEAARAGEAGRGFAVVATEVRALAQRSSNAAREINALISASGEMVRRGVNLVDRTGSALDDIVASVSEISELVSGIAGHASEQSTSIREINTAVNELDRATQQNAAMFEQTTAASQAMVQNAGALNASVARFRGSSSAERGAGPSPDPLARSA